MFAFLFAAVVVTLAAPWVAAISGIVIPFLTGLITKAGAPSGVKGIVMLVLVAIVTVLTAIVKGNGVLDSQTIADAFVALIVSVLWLYNIHLPWGLDQLKVLLPNKGIGTDPESLGGI